jgi:hypothetical protein
MEASSRNGFKGKHNRVFGRKEREKGVQMMKKIPADLDEGKN